MTAHQPLIGASIRGGWALPQPPNSVPLVNISIAGATFLGQAIPIGVLIVVVEARFLALSGFAWRMATLLGLAMVIGGAGGAMYYCFVAVNNSQPLDGAQGWIVVGGSLALSCAVIVALSATIVLKLAEAEENPPVGGADGGRPTPTPPGTKRSSRPSIRPSRHRSARSARNLTSLRASSRE